MKLVSFRIPSPTGFQVRGGAVVSEHVVIDLEASHRVKLLQDGYTESGARRISEALTPPDMTAFIEGGDVSLDAARAVLEWAGIPPGNSTAFGIQYTYALENLHLLCPVPRPRLIRDFMVFETHLKNIFPKLGREIPPEWYKLPVYYKGNPHAVGAHGEDIPMPDYATELDFEFEFGIVIGKQGRNIPKEKAMEHVFGYMLYNDFSAREIQSREMSVGLAKGKDFGHAHVFGPWLVTADEIEDVYNLPMICRINGEPYMESNSGTMHWKIDDMIRHASWEEAIYPGEIFGSGTVGEGAGAERGEFLHPGDVIELEMGPLGVLRNRVI